MRPILLRWRQFTMWSFPALLYFGMVAGIVAGNLAAHSAGLNAARVYVATLLLLIPGFIGAKLLYVVTHWSHYQLDPRSIFTPNQGGAAQFGGFILAFLFSWPVLAVLHLPFGAFWDVAVLTLLVLMICGRIGCLLHGCCAGRPTQSWIGIHLPNRSGQWRNRIPTQALEAAWGAILLITAIAVRNSVPFPGALFLFVTAAYAAGRLVLESTREETSIHQFTIHHKISALLMTLSLVVLAVKWPG
jgi:phosphatidylglycerol:prolipoprotein diacylglycerol transferase